MCMVTDTVKGMIRNLRFDKPVDMETAESEQAFLCPEARAGITRKFEIDFGMIRVHAVGS